MDKSAIKGRIPKVVDVTVSKNSLTVELSDGRTISVPLVWFPRLQYATPREWKKWRLIGNGRGIHWDSLDEDISVEGLLAGVPSGESWASASQQQAVALHRNRGRSRIRRRRSERPQ